MLEKVAKINAKVHTAGLEKDHVHDQDYGQEAALALVADIKALKMLCVQLEASPFILLSSIWNHNEKDAPQNPIHEFNPQNSLRVRTMVRRLLRCH